MTRPGHDDMDAEAREIAEAARASLQRDREDEQLLERLRQRALTGDVAQVQAWALLRIAAALERQVDAVEEIAVVMREDEA